MDDNITMQMRQGIGRGAQENVWRYLNTECLTQEEALRAITLFFWDADAAHAWTEQVLLDRQENGHVVDVLEPSLDAAFRAMLSSQWVKKVGNLDALSILSAAGATEDRMWETYRLYNEDVFVETLLTPGRLGLIHGPAMGVGKTDYAVRLMPPIVASGVHDIVTNIPVVLPQGHPARERVHVESRLSSSLKRLLELKRAGRKAVWFLDESNSFLSKQDASSKNVKDFDKLLRWFRKLGVSVVLLTHLSERDVPSKWMEFITVRFTKERKTTVRVDVRDAELHLFKRLSGVPRATWEFDTYGLGGLDMDVDMQDLVAWINSQGPDQDVFQLMRRYLDTPSLHGTAGEQPEEDERDDFDLADEIAQNSEYWQENGRADIVAIRRAFKVTQGKAYQLAKLARGARS